MKKAWQSGQSPDSSDTSPQELKAVPVDKDTFEKAIQNMTPVASRIIDPERKLPLDLYLPFTGRDATVRLIKVFKEGSEPSSEYLRKMRGLGMDEFFIERQRRKLLLEYVAGRTMNILQNSGPSVEEKCEAVYDNAMLLIRSALEDDNLPDNLQKGLEYSRTFASVVRDNPVLIYKLPELLTVDYDLYNHSVNVCVLSTAFGAYLKLEDYDAVALSAGALYHDIGKKFIDPNILTKPSGLDPMEWAEIRTHPQHSFRILAEQQVLPVEALEIAAQHHENLDGSGYPNGLADGEISYLATIVRIIDAYDAITSERCYKPALKPLEAVQIMIKEMGRLLSMELLRKFLEFMSVISQGRNKRGYDSE